MLPHRLRISLLNPIPPANLQHPRPPLTLDLLVHRSPADPPPPASAPASHPSAPGRVAKSLQPHPLQQTRIYQSPAHNNLRPPRPDPRHRRPLIVIHLHQPVRKTSAHPECPPTSSPPAPAVSSPATSSPQPSSARARSPPPALPPFPTSQSPTPPAASPASAAALRSSRSMNCFSLATSSFCGRISLQKLLLQPHRAQRHAHHRFEPPSIRHRHLAAPATQVDQQTSPPRPHLMRHHAQVNQPSLLQPRDHLDIPSRSRFHPLRKRLRVPGIPHRARRHHANLVGNVHLHRFMKALQRANRRRHRLGRDHPHLKHTLTQPRHLTVFVQRLQPMCMNRSNLQPARIGPNIDRSKRWHCSWLHLSTQKNPTLARYIPTPAHPAHS